MLECEHFIARKMLGVMLECEHFIDTKMLVVMLEEKNLVLEFRRWLLTSNYKDLSHRRTYGRQSVTFPRFSDSSCLFYDIPC
jgi:hypothetical protein